MAKKKNKKTRVYRFHYRTRKIRVILDNVLIFGIIRRIHGRFWGVAGITGLFLGFAVCFLIRPDLLTVSTAFSDFGSDVRTAPYFAGAVFFCAFSMWRWQKYLARTWRHTMPVTGLILLTVIGLYLIALMPVAWKPVAYRVHLFGVILAGISMLATVILDNILTKTKRTRHTGWWRLIRLFSFVLIVVGSYITLGSAEIVGWWRLSMVGEVLLLLGYFIWIVVKTYQGEGGRTPIGRMLSKVVLVS